MSTSSEPQLTAEEIQDLQAKFTRFRVLVIGRANAGKTTVLRRLCDSTGEPTIFSPDGEKIESSALNPSVGRGEHDIKNQMIFKSNSGFIFHDSRGFEAGSAQELKLVQDFIKERSKATHVKEQLHAIWYCIPTSDDRPITAAEKKFFNECGTGLVPVIVLWTKTDALDADKIMQLIKEGKSKAEAMQQGPQKAWTDFEQNIPEWFGEFKYPPKAYVVFRNMHEPGADCKDLIEKTAAALSSEELQQLLLSTQQNNVELCVAYGVRRGVNETGPILLKYFKDNQKHAVDVMATVLGYFPHIRIVWLYKGMLEEVRRLRTELRENKEAFGRWGDHLESRLWELDEHMFRDDALNSLNWVWVARVIWDMKFNKKEKKMLMNDRDDLMRVLNKEEAFNYTTNECHNTHSLSKIMSSILSGLSPNINSKETTYCAIVTAILGHLSFFLYKESPSTADSLERAVQIYQQSPCDTSVKQAVNNYFENLSKGSHVNHKLLVQEAVQIAMNNLISRK